MKGTSVNFKAAKFISHFNSNYTKCFVAKLNSLNISDPYNVSGGLYRNTTTAQHCNVIIIVIILIPSKKR